MQLLISAWDIPASGVKFLNWDCACEVTLNGIRKMGWNYTATNYQFTRNRVHFFGCTVYLIICMNGLVVNQYIPILNGYIRIVIVSYDLHGQYCACMFKSMGKVDNAIHVQMCLVRLRDDYLFSLVHVTYTVCVLPASLVRNISIIKAGGHIKELHDAVRITVSCWGESSAHRWLPSMTTLTCSLVSFTPAHTSCWINSWVYTDSLMRCHCSDLEISVL